MVSSSKKSTRTALKSAVAMLKARDPKKLFFFAFVFVDFGNTRGFAPTAAEVIQL